ncbi:MAG: hypothetical protein ACYTGJ_07340 [Planctomycetota bacterium]|jgi:hypothetical protein
MAPEQTPTVERPEVALGRLQEMRRSRRALRVRTGLFRWLALAGLLVWASFLLDYFLSLPVGVRGFHIVAAAVALAVGFKLLLLAARSPIAEDRLAAEIETAAGDLEQALITAIQLTRPDNPRRELCSPVLLARTVATAEARMKDLRPGSLLSRRLANRALLGALLILGPIAGGAALRPDLAETFVQRNLLLESVEWPRAYLLTIEEPATPMTLLAVGDALTVQATRERGGEARARIVAFFTDAEGEETREEFPFERRGEGSFRRIFTNVSRDFRFRVLCGDFASPWYEVAVRSRPRIETISLRFDYPDYTGLDAEVPAAALEGGHLKVPVGTLVSYEATTSIPVREAARVETRRAGDGEWRDEQPVPITEGDRLAGTFTAEQDGYYHFRLVSRDGFENPTPIRYRIAVIEDQAPGVQLIEPGRNQELTNRATLRVSAHLSDDYGIEEASLCFFRDGELGGEPLHVVPLSLEAVGTRKTVIELELELKDWELAPGTRLEYVARATDAIGQLGESRAWLLTILEEDEVRRVLEEETERIRELVQETFELQRDARRGVEELEEQARVAGGELPEESRASLRHQRMSQERVNRRIDDTMERFEELVDRVVQNRLTDYKDLPWIQQLKERLSTIGEESAEPSLEQLDALTERAETEEVGPRDLREAADRMRRSELGLQQLADELEEWGDVQTIIRKLEDLLNTQSEVEATVRERIRETLGEPPGESGGD